MAAKIGLGFQAEQGVEDAAVAQVDFGAFDQALFQIGEQGGKAANHVGLGEHVKVVADGDRGDPERLAKLAAVEELAVVVGEHLPEAVKGFSRNAEAELGDVAFEKGADEFHTPTGGGFVAGGQQAVGKSAAQPEPGKVFYSHFGKAEGGEFDVGDAPGQRFAGLAK